MSWPLGVVSITYTTAGFDLSSAAQRARDAGFDHIDLVEAEPAGALALAIGDRLSETPRPGYTSPSLLRGARTFEALVDEFRAVPGSRVEPLPHTLLGSSEAVRAMIAAVPGLRLNLDVGHVTGWGGDPLEFLRYADHVQLRQASPGEYQARDGDVDFGAILRELAHLDYAGLLSVEYFDLPDHGFPFDDPVGAACDVARCLRGLMR